MNLGTDAELIERICDVAGSPGWLSRLRIEMSERGLAHAVAANDTDKIVDWLLEVFSFQGISDQVALNYLNAHGRVTSAELVAGLADATCPKLTSYWAFDRCGYEKSWGSCAEPQLVATCPLPTHDLRNGRLNQTAYALLLFCRDIADRDLVEWIDQQLDRASAQTFPDQRARWAALRRSLLEPLGHIYGVSNKVLSMALSDLLIGAGADRAGWVETGISMIAVDTLVHNWLARTGVIRRRGVTHPYGPACYASGGCADVIETLSLEMDARQFDLEFPEHFPRFVQKAIWSFCAGTELDRCNGNRIDDRFGCEDAACPVGDRCERLPLAS